MNAPIESRAAAGRQLARVLEKYRGRDDVMILGIVPGGIPAAAEIARALELPLDVIVVRKLVLHGHGGLSFGAIAGSTRVLDWGVVSGLDVADETIDTVTAAEQAQLERLTALYRGIRPPPRIEGRTVILVDDGVVTGGSMRAAVGAVRAERPAELIMAVGAAPYDVLTDLQTELDELVCLAAPHPFCGLDRCYWEYGEASQDETRALLAARWAAEERRPNPACVALPAAASGATRSVSNSSVPAPAARPPLLRRVTRSTH